MSISSPLPLWEPRGESPCWLKLQLISKILSLKNRSLKIASDSFLEYGWFYGASDITYNVSVRLIQIDLAKWKKNLFLIGMKFVSSFKMENELCYPPNEVKALLLIVCSGGFHDNKWMSYLILHYLLRWRRMSYLIYIFCNRDSSSSSSNKYSR